jgi:hypothetical protein
MPVAAWSRLRRGLLTAVAIAVVLNSASALAGTTGSLIGTVVDGSTSAPIADAKITVTSPSQTAQTRSDARGGFTFVSLAPDTYTLSIEKEGYEPLSTTGISVFADQSQTLAFKINKSLKTIANVKTRSSLNLVRSGTITDVYSVNGAVTQAASPLGGGANMNNAYSAIASQPGAYVPPGQVGVNQNVYIRGGFYDQVGYEYDGVPLNRSFDNYPGNPLSTMGQQELQIYAGGGGAGANATGLAGFVNQVAKTGTYPGYATIAGSIGAPTFYHNVNFEAGGSTPDRLFSYYVGLQGYDQAIRYFDNTNGAGLMNEFPYTTGPANVTTFLPYYPAVYPTCTQNATYTNTALDKLSNDPGCYAAFFPGYSEASMIDGRQTVINLHFGIPHKHDAGKDDVQLLYTNSAQYEQYYAGVDDAGASFVNALVNQGFIDTPHWPDYYTYPGGTSFLAPANVKPIAYMFPGSPTNRCANIAYLPNSCPYNANTGDITDPSQLPADYRPGRWDTASVMKLQYQKNFGSNAYLRAFGYIFYSYDDRSDPTHYGIGSGFAATNYEYEVNAHTRGVQLDFGDQVNSQNLVTATYNYLTSSTWRLNNSNYYNDAYQQVSNLTNGTLCYAYSAGTGENGQAYTPGERAPCNDPITQGTFGTPTNGQPLNPCSMASLAGTPACAAGAAWKLTYTGNQGVTNAVQPAFTNASVTDEWRPTDKIDVSVGTKYSLDNFTLQDTNNPGTNFWYAAARNEFCYNPVTYNVVLIPVPPQEQSQESALPTLNCPVDRSSGTPVQTVHPNGKDGHIYYSNSYPPVYSQNYWQPRLGFTFTANPDTVIRASAGRYAQEPQNYEIQYSELQQNLAADLIGFIPFGFFTPFHPALPQYSDNYDLSFERHFTGTDMSIKVTPYYRYATQQLDEDVNIPTLLASPSLNAGTQISDGVEFQFTKGDFNRNGLSGVFSYTYLSSVEKWNNFQGVPVNAVSPYNEAIQDFNALTRAGGGARCYVNSGSSTIPIDKAVLADPTCKNIAGYSPPILNPYFKMAPQALLAPYAWYDTGLDYPYTSPNVFALILNYKHNRFSITPALTLNEGATYGNPYDVQGIDPRTCSSNQGTQHIPTNEPLAADYTSCGSAATATGTLYIPNPKTGTFDSFDAFRQPWQLNMGLQLHYDVTPRIAANLTVTNLVNQCFGGSRESWTSAYPPNQNVCGYISNLFYVSNQYNGTSPNDVAANGAKLNQYFTQPFVPAYGDAQDSYNFPLAIGFYFQLQVKL